ncbi:MAG: cytochrome c-type biogenesis protein [Pseudomonadota bacterium]|nr:cytochrome c-type biogenesis protein [Pseudomonadota bacterium]
MKKMFLLIVALMVFASMPSLATIDAYQFDDPEKEALYKKLIKELRCTVCQNQDIGDSNADLAKDLRRKTYEMISSGKDEEYVLDFMSQRYGDFVLYRPRMQSNTILLWVGPFIILIFAVFFLLRFIRRPSADVSLTETDRAQAEKLLERDE